MLKNIDKRTRLLILALWINFGVILTLILVYIREYIEVGRLTYYFEGRYLLITLVTIVSFTLGLGIKVLFLVWFKKAYKNLSISGIKTSHSDHMAIFSWFIPFINLFLPVTMVNEIHKKSLKHIEEHKLGSKYFIEDMNSRFYISIWWIFWLCSFGIFLFVEPVFSVTRNYSGLLICVGLRQLVNAILTWNTITLIKRINTLQEKLTNINLIELFGTEESDSNLEMDEFV